MFDLRFTPELYLLYFPVWLKNLFLGTIADVQEFVEIFVWDAGILLGEIFISVAKEYQLLLARDFDCRLSADM